MTRKYYFYAWYLIGIVNKTSFILYIIVIKTKNMHRVDTNANLLVTTILVQIRGI